MENNKPYFGQLPKAEKNEAGIWVKGGIVERDPNGVDAKAGGSKLDAGKPSVWRGLFDYFPRACLAVADVSTRGAQKYSWKGWETVPDGEARYADALSRHIIKESIEGLYDVGPGGLPEVLHASQVAWNALARLELILRRLDATNSTTISDDSQRIHPGLNSTGATLVNSMGFNRHPVRESR